MVNTKPVQSGKTTRQSFSKINEVINMPNLIGIQKDNYQWFLDEGIKEVFKDVSPIVDSNGKIELSFVNYRLEENTKYSIEECKERDATYAAPLKVTASLLNKETGEIIDNEIYMGDLPLMTESGTFVINGSERVVVSQLVRSPGVYYGFDYDKTGKKLFKATVIPNRGAWLELEMDGSDVFYVRIDKNRKFPCTTFLRAIGLSGDADLINKFGEDPRITVTIENGKDNTKNEEEALLEVYRKLRPGEPATVDSARTTLDNLFFDAKRYDLSRFGRYKYNKKLGIAQRLVGKKAAENVVAPLSGELLAEEGGIITADMAMEIQNSGVMEVSVYKPEGEGVMKIVGNGMVDIHLYTGDLDVEALVINEQVKFGVLSDIIEEAGDDRDLLLYQPQRGRGRHRRYRPPRKQTYPLRGRAAPEPVQNRLYANGAHYPRENGTSGERYRKGNAVVAYQRETSDCGYEGILRLFAAVAVHGSEQPARGAYSQAPSVLARSGRTFA